MLAPSELARTSSGKLSSRHVELKVAIKAFAKIQSKLLSIPKSYFLGIGLVFIIIFVVSYYSIDPDFGWHLQSGRHYLAFGIPKTDIFTFSAPNFPWINHEWLNDSFIALLFGLGGYTATAVFFAIVWTSAFIIAGRRYSTAVLLFASVSTIPFIGIRPVAWTALFIAIIERIINNRNKKYSYLLPVIFLLWANLHGSFVLGLLLLMLWQIFAKNKMPWTAIVLSFLAVLINPYGPRVYEEIIRTASDSQLRFRISEWQMFVLPFLSFIYLIIFSAFHFVFSKKPIKDTISIPGLLLVMTLSSIRHFPVFVVTSLRYLEDYAQQFTAQINQIKLNKPKLAILIAILGLPIVVLLYFLLTNIRGVVAQNNGYPNKAISYLSTNTCPGNIFNSYNYGGYLIWKLPEQKVYIDGRMPSWKHQGVDYFKKYEQVLSKDEFRHYEFDKYNIRCVLVNRRDNSFKVNRAVPFGEQLTNEGWQLIQDASTPDYSLYLKP